MMKLATLLASALIALPGASAARPAAGPGDTSCYADCDESEERDFFDFLCFQNEFALQTPYADCDGSGSHDFFDFLCFQNAFAAGCPEMLTLIELGSEAPPAMICDEAMTAFPEPAFGPPVTRVPSPLGGELVFSIECGIVPTCGFAGCFWSHGYNGRVYETGGATSVSIDVPASSAFYLYAAPGPFVVAEFEITGTGHGSEVSVIDTISGVNGAKGFAFCGGVQTVTVRATDGVTAFQFGEFGIAD